MVEKIKQMIDEYENNAIASANDDIECLNECNAVLDALDILLKYAVEKQKTCCAGRKE